MNPFQSEQTVSIVHFLPGERQKKMHAVYEANRRRVYSFAFWMTDSEPMAEQILERTFLRAFSIYGNPSDEEIDRVLLRELKTRAGVSLQPPELRCDPSREVGSVRHNTRRIDLERAVVQLPYTERMIYCMHDGEGYEHQRIARTLGIAESESRQALLHARLRLRELLAAHLSQKLA
jgi:RNA polymerase sigma-70 factor, ECF subfamily